MHFLKNRPPIEVISKGYLGFWFREFNNEYLDNVSHIQYSHFYHNESFTF